MGDRAERDRSSVFTVSASASTGDGSGGFEFLDPLLACERTQCKAAPAAATPTSPIPAAHDASEVVRQPVAEAFLDELWRSRTGALSTQVPSEF